MNLSRIRRPRTTRAKVAAGVAAVAVVGSTGAAIAAYFSTAGIGGQGRTGTFTASWHSASTTAADGTTVSTLAGPAVSSGRLTLPMGLEFFPEQAYVFDAKVKAVGADGYVSGIALPGLPAGYEAEVVGGCGAPVPVSASTGVPVTVAIRATDAVDMSGGTWSLDPAAGLHVTVGTAPASVSCPVYDPAASAA